MRDYRDRPRLEALGVPREIPWEIVAPHEAQAKRNHDQTLERLAERGGLGVAELLAVLTGQRYRDIKATDLEAAPELVALLAVRGADLPGDVP